MIKFSFLFFYIDISNGKCQKDCVENNSESKLLARLPRIIRLEVLFSTTKLCQ